MDALHDNSNRTWYQIGTQYEKHIPDYIWNYSPLTKEASEKLQPSQFADDVNHMFPISSKEATWLSAVYFTKNADQLPLKPVIKEHVKSNIMKAAEVYGIKEDIDKIISAMTTVEKKASVDSDYGLVIKNANGEVIERSYPMFNMQGVKLASDYFIENRQHYPGPIRMIIAKSIMQKSAEYKVEVPETIRKEAGYGIPSKEILVNELMERAHMAKDAETSAALANVGVLFGSLPMSEFVTELDKIAEVIETFDRSEGFNKFYGKKILMPADIVYDIDLRKAAEFAEDAVELNKFVFSITKLASLKPDVYVDILGDAFVSRVMNKEGKLDTTKLANELYSLPRPDKAALEEHLERLFT